MPKGHPKVPRQACRKGHPWTPENTLWEKDRRVRRCAVCRDASKFARLRRKHRPRPDESGFCMSGRHRWSEQNVYTDSEGQHRCRPCHDEAYARNYKLKKVITCIVRGCPRATHRLGETYVCKNHRANPPLWFERLGFRIVGTELLAS